MIVSLTIIVLLVLAFRYGLKRGFLMSLLSLAGYIMISLLSLFFAKPLGNVLASFFPTMDNQGQVMVHFLYPMLSFWIVTIVLGIVYRIVIGTFGKVVKLPIISQVNALVGAVFSTLVMYVMIFLGLLLFSAFPNSHFSQSIQESTVAQIIIKQTPLISDYFLNDYINIHQRNEGEIYE